MQANTPVVGFFRQLQSAMPELVPRVAPAAAAELAWAFAKAGLYYPDVFGQICEHHLAAGAEWEPQGACKALWAQAAMGVSHPELTARALRVVHAARRELDNGPKVLAAHCVASITLVHGLHVTDDTFEVWLQHCRHNCQNAAMLDGYCCCRDSEC